MFKRILALSAALLLAGCVNVDYNSLLPGTFKGTLIVMWVGEGSSSSGDGKFVFVPDPRDPLTFTRAGDGPGKVIRPGVMYTDGGSIPSIAQVFKGLHPWGYAPAYMIHDWLFTAHHCIKPGQHNSQYDSVADVKFEDSTIILGEAIQGLVHAGTVDKNDVAGDAITWAVGTGTVRKLWKEGACVQVQPKYLAQIELAVPGSTTLSVARNRIQTFDEIRKIAPSAKPARVLTTLQF